MDGGAQLLLIGTICIVGVILLGARMRRASATSEPMSDGQRSGVLAVVAIVAVAVVIALLAVSSNTARMLG